MKCTKCGYVSFDYLSECKKCRTSLTAARDGFGFAGEKPTVPFLLGSLLSVYESPAHMESTVVETEMSTPFSFGEGVGDGFRLEKPENQTGEIASAVVNPDESEEDFSLLDLSDEELELLIDRESFGSVEVEAIPPGSDRGSTGNRAPEPLLTPEPTPFEISLPEGETQSAAETAQDELALEFDDYPHGLDSEPEITPTVELIPELLGDPKGLAQAHEDTDEFKLGPEQAWPEPEGSIDDFVIELSENDLETLLEELRSTPKGET
ncbi:MAG: hypothetical protein ABSF90_14350 [Syntrophobacteraceae bacterium]|jgi:hypothetical protein